MTVIKEGMVINLIRYGEKLQKSKGGSGKSGNNENIVLMCEILQMKIKVKKIKGYRTL